MLQKKNQPRLTLIRNDNIGGSHQAPRSPQREMQRESPITLCHNGCWKDVTGGLDSSHINQPNLLSLRHAVRGQARPGKHLNLKGIGRAVGLWSSEQR